MHLWRVDDLFVLFAVRSESYPAVEEYLQIRPYFFQCLLTGFSRTRLISTSIHEGTPDKLVTLTGMVLLAIASILVSHSLIKAIFLLGTRMKLISGLTF